MGNSTTAIIGQLLKGIGRGLWDNAWAILKMAAAQNPLLGPISWYAAKDMHGELTRAIQGALASADTVGGQVLAVLNLFNPMAHLADATSFAMVAAEDGDWEGVGYHVVNAVVAAAAVAGTAAGGVAGARALKGRMPKPKPKTEPYGGRGSRSGGELIETIEPYGGRGSRSGGQLLETTPPPKGLQTPRRYFAGKNKAEVELALEAKYGPPRSVRPSAKTYYNPKTGRSYNVHHDPGHRGGRPHVDVRTRGDIPERKFDLRVD